MIRSNLGAVCAATLVACSLAGTEVLAAEGQSQRDLTAYACKDVMRLSGEDREIALALVHGYVLGKKGTTRYEIEALAQITDRFVDYCLDHPTENALKSFEDIAK